jgi:hypothetical protein
MVLSLFCLVSPTLRTDEHPACRDPLSSDQTYNAVELIAIARSSHDEVVTDLFF